MKTAWLGAHAHDDVVDVGGSRSLVYWFSTSTMVPLLIAALTSLFLFDAVLGTLLAVRRGVTEVPWLSRLGVVGLGTGLLLGAFVGALSSVVVALVSTGAVRRVTSTLQIGRLLVVAIAFAGVFLLNRSTFEGGGIASHPRVREIRFAFHVAALVGIVIVVVTLARHWFAPRHGRSTFASLALAAGYFAVAAALHAVNAVVHVGRYEDIHVQIVVVTALLHVFAWVSVFSTLEDMVPASKRAALIFGLVAAIVGGCAIIGGSLGADTHRLRAALRGPARPVLSRWVDWTKPWVLDRFLAAESIAHADIADLISKLDRAPIDRAALDAVLGDERSHWNVVFVAADALRADAVDFVPPSSRTPSLTPALDDFASKSIVFERAYTPYPTSNYAYSSFLTGYYPRRTPAREGVMHRPIGLPEKPSIAELLSARGYQTFAVTAFNANGIAQPEYFSHLKSGFDVFNPLANKMMLDAPQVTRSALDLIESRDRSRPFLLFAHYMDPHDPYVRHPEFDYGKSARGAYDSEIAYLDRHVAPLLNRLRADDLASNTLVLFFSDHGEAFGEHDTAFHNSSLFEEQIRVPFVLHVPGREAAVVSSIANLVDVVPTTLSILGIEDPLARHGRDLAPLIFGLRSMGEWVDYSYSERFLTPSGQGRLMHRALVHDGLKLIRVANDPTLEIYDLEADPGESRIVTDLTNLRHRRLAALMDELDRRIDPPVASSNEVPRSDVVTRAESIIERFEDDVFDNDRVAAIDSFTLLVGTRFELSGFAVDEIGPTRLKKITGYLERVVRSPGSDDAARFAAMCVLMLVDDPDLEVLMLECAVPPTSPVSVGAAFWLANRGDARGRGLLEETLSHPDTDVVLRTAVALGRVGASNIDRWLQLGLTQTFPPSLIRVVRGLDGTRAPDRWIALRERIALDLQGYRTRPVLECVASLAAADESPEATNLLADIASSAWPEARRTARDALASRFASSEVEALFARSERTMMANAAFRDADFAGAAQLYGEGAAAVVAGGRSDEWQRLQVGIALAAAGEFEESSSVFHDLVAEPLTHGEIRRRARGYLDAANLRAPFRVSPRDLKLRAEIVGQPTLQPIPGNQFMARVRLYNLGEQPIVGGIWPFAPRLAWVFRSKATGELDRSEKLPVLMQNFLPGGVCGAKDAIEMDVLGMTPNAAELFTPELILTVRPWYDESQIVLLSLEPISFAIR